MIKKLLSSIYKIFSYEYDRERIEKYLSQSENTYDLEMRIRELEKSGKYKDFIFKMFFVLEGFSYFL